MSKMINLIVSFYVFLLPYIEPQLKEARKPEAAFFFNEKDQ